MIAQIDTLTAEIPLEVIEREFHSSLWFILSCNEKIALLKSIYLFAALPDKKIDYLVGIIKEIEYEEGQSIIE